MAKSFYNHSHDRIMSSNSLESNQLVDHHEIESTRKNTELQVEMKMRFGSTERKHFSPDRSQNRGTPPGAFVINRGENKELIDVFVEAHMIT
jgi:hypothetical protein